MFTSVMFDRIFKSVSVIGDNAEYAIIFGYEADPNTLAINRTDGTPLVVGPLSGGLYYKVITIIIERQRSCGKVVFSVLFVILSVCQSICSQGVSM